MPFEIRRASGKSVKIAKKNILYIHVILKKFYTELLIAFAWLLPLHVPAPPRH